MTIFVEKNHWFEDLNVIIFKVVYTRVMPSRSIMGTWWPLTVHLGCFSMDVFLGGPYWLSMSHVLFRIG